MTNEIHTKHLSVFNAFCGSVHFFCGNKKAKKKFDYDQFPSTYSFISYHKL